MSETTTALQTHLDSLRAAWWELAAGGKAVTLSYDMGAGKKSVTYTAASPDVLRSAISSLEARLGIPMCDRTFRRRAIGVRFAGAGGGRLW